MAMTTMSTPTPKMVEMFPIDEGKIKFMGKKSELSMYVLMLPARLTTVGLLFGRNRSSKGDKGSP